MKILLDENIDVRMKQLFPEVYEVYTVRDMRWNGVKNGKLIQLLAENNFECWIVVDKNIPYQQNIFKLPCLIIVLDIYRNTLKHLLPLIPKIMEVLNAQKAEKVVIIN